MTQASSLSALSHDRVASAYFVISNTFGGPDVFGRASVPVVELAETIMGVGAAEIRLVISDWVGVAVTASPVVVVVIVVLELPEALRCHESAFVGPADILL